MPILMGKFKNGEWEEVESTEPNSDKTEQEKYLLYEYKAEFGQSWMFKWVE